MDETNNASIADDGPSSSKIAKLSEEDEGKYMQQMIDSCRAFIAKKIGQDEAVKQLRKILV
jgi:hypothetical protein